MARWLSSSFVVAAVFGVAIAALTGNIPLGLLSLTLIIIVACTP